MYSFIHLLRRRLGGTTAEQVEDLDQTRSKDNENEKGDKSGADAWAVLVALRDLAGVDISPLGNVLVEFAVSIADVSGEWLRKNKKERGELSSLESIDSQKSACCCWVRRLLRTSIAKRISSISSCARMESVVPMSHITSLVYNSPS